MNSEFEYLTVTHIHPILKLVTIIHNIPYVYIDIGNLIINNMINKEHKVNFAAPQIGRKK